MSQDYVNLSRSLQLDENDLDRCAVEQPELFRRVSEEFTIAQSRRDQAKYDLELAAADVDRFVRSSYEKSDKRITEKTIQTDVELHKDVKAAKEELLSAQRQLSKWNALKESFDQRKDMLKVLAQLYAANYFTRAGVSGATSSINNTDANHVRAAVGAERRTRMKE